MQSTLVLLVLAVALATAPAALAATESKVKTETTPFIRGHAAFDNMRLDPKGRFIAFTSTDAGTGQGLSVVDTKTQSIFKVSGQRVGASFFWSPDGFRLFYRELIKTRAGKIESHVKAYDTALGRSVTLDRLKLPTGFLTFDPRDLRMQLMSAGGVHTKRIYFPDERLARWQIAQRTENGKFLATQSGVLWLTQGGMSVRRLDDDGSKLQAFDISPDGTTIAWATEKSAIYTSKNGKTPKFLAHGRDPQWHPEKPLLLFAGARMVGNKAVSFDLKVSDLKSGGRFLTTTQHVDERWPQWHPKGLQVLYTLAKMTDVYLLDFKQ
jgi:Tol biopolymer transport system component